MQHKGKSVDELLRQSVSEHLNRSSYNSTDEIAALLKRLDFKIEEHSRNFAVIDQMIQRRHQIVHRADRVKAADSDTYVLQQIERSEVTMWLDATFRFTSSLLKPLFFKLGTLRRSPSNYPPGS